MKIERKLIEDAYRKLKGSVYLDKTMPILNADIALYEKDIERNIDKIVYLLNKSKPDEWNSFVEELLGSIRVFTFPKEVISAKKEKSEKEDPIVISNIVDDESIVKKYSNFIDLRVDGHILGVLWILLVGYKIDAELSENCYANRLNKQLIFEEGKTTASPSLFRPYYTNYSKWRDEALAIAEKELGNKKNIIITMIDIHRFFYSIDLGSEKDFIKSIGRFSDKRDSVQKRLNSLIYRIFREYSDICGFDNTALPVGFLPSNIISNYYLLNIDSIFGEMDLSYYGRYVDDIIFVRKISDTEETIIRDAEKYNEKVCDTAMKPLIEHGLVEKKGNDFCFFSHEKLKFEKSKVRFFHLNSSDGYSIINRLREDINRNSSEFRIMPDMDADERFYDIWDIDRADTPNKLRSVNRVKLDKYALSKIIAKQIIVSYYATEEYNQKILDELKISLSNSDFLDAYTLWENYINLCVEAKKIEETKRAVEKCINAIHNMDEDKYKYDEYSYLKKQRLYSVEDSLSLLLVSAISRVFSGVWGKDAGKVFCELQEELRKESLSFLSKERGWERGNDNCMLRRCFFDARMIKGNKEALAIEPYLKRDIFKDTGDLIYVNKLETVLQEGNNCSKGKGSNYKYRPYIQTPFDILYQKLLKEISEGKKLSDNNNQLMKYLEKWYGNNFGSSNSFFDEVLDIRMNTAAKQNVVRVNSENQSNETVRIAVANVKMSENDNDGKNRAIRYKEIQLIVNQAIENKANILVMPEAYIPIEMLPILQKKSAREQLLIIGGVEHIESNGKTYNITCILMPFEKKRDEDDESIKYTFPFFQQKQYFSPHEKEKMTMQASEGNEHPLFIWNDIVFAVVCCFDLTSLELRNQYSGYVDFLFAIEWNKDTLYFSNIIESYSRDALCFCVQCNNSSYGDSRIIQPTKRDMMNIMRIQGGDNATVLIGNVELSKFKEYRNSDNNSKSQFQKKQSREKCEMECDKRGIFKPKPAGWKNKQKNIL